MTTPISISILLTLMTSWVVLQVDGHEKMLSLETRGKNRCAELMGNASYKTNTLYDLIYTEKCLPEGWKKFFNATKPMIKVISDRLQQDTDDGLGLNPKIGWVFRAFNMVPLKNVEVVILGQDPAPEPGLATGLAFSLKLEVPAYEVPSVQRVLLEARNEGFCINDTNGDLIPWARQGVLLLNTALTLIDEEIGSHIPLWRDFTKEVIAFISKKAKPSVWILWGSKAKAFASEIDTSRHFIITGGHPSPRANGKYFFCQNYFACGNKWFKSQGRKGIDWNLAPVPCKKYESRLYGRKYEYPGYYEEETCIMRECDV